METVSLDLVTACFAMGRCRTARSTLESQPATDIPDGYDLSRSWLTGNTNN